jgi:hypothetical protein
MVVDRHMARSRLPTIALGLAMMGALEARADRIVLRGGTQIRGVLLTKGAQPGQVLVQTEALATPIKYRKEQVVEVIPEPSPLKDYLDLRDQAAADAQSQYDLGLWCEQHKLPPFAELHYRRAIELDKEFAPAHKKLGHVLYADRWITGDELREAQGLVKFRGKWISKEEKAKADGEVASAAEKAAWGRRLKVLRNALINGSPERQQEAEEQLTAIRDPTAVRPLVGTFGEDPEVLRKLLSRILGGIPGDEAASALVARILAETDQGVRESTMDELTRREEPTVIPQLVRALRSRDPAVINRAAWALASLSAVAAVPKLVQALVLVDQKVVWASQENSGGGGNIGVGFTSIGNSPVGSPGGMAHPGGGFNSPSSGLGGVGFGYTVPYGVLNSVAVAPGVVAFGGGPGYLTTGGGLSMGESTPSRGLQPGILTSTFRNVEVLNALQKLTGQNFGYDPDAWRRWVSTSFRPDPTPARRVPQP